MRYKTYILSSRLSAETAIERLGDLLSKAEVQYKINGLSISSTRTPIVVFNLQRAMYSKRNWVGLSPFPYISGVDLRCQPGKGASTEVIVQVNRGRTFVYLAFSICACGIASTGMPTLADAVLFIAVSSAVAWLSCVSLSGYLLKKEITNCLKA